MIMGGLGHRNRLLLLLFPLRPVLVRVLQGRAELGFAVRLGCVYSVVVTARTRTARPRILGIALQRGAAFRRVRGRFRRDPRYVVVGIRVRRPEHVFNQVLIRHGAPREGSRTRVKRTFRRDRGMIAFWRKPAAFLSDMSEIEN